MILSVSLVVILVVTDLSPKMMENFGGSHTTAEALGCHIASRLIVLMYYSTDRETRSSDSVATLCRSWQLPVPQLINVKGIFGLFIQDN